MEVINFYNPAIIPSDLSTNKLLGRGKYSVYKGEVLGRNEDCAIKIFPSNQTAQNAYIRERKVISMLRHNHIINFIPNTKSRDKNKNLLLVMEYAPYGDFFDLIMSRELTSETLIRTYFQQLIEGMSYLHSRGIAHLDLKLDNLLLGKDYLLKITDFDLAHNQKETSKPVSRGTTGYRAPEVMLGEFENIFAADVYSIGVILFICLTGEFPFYERDTENGKELRDYDLFKGNNEIFWRKKSTYYGVHFSQNLRELFNGMFTQDPQTRFTIKDIKASNWYQEQVIEPFSLEREMKLIHEKVKSSQQ